MPETSRCRDMVGAVRLLAACTDDRIRLRLGACLLLVLVGSLSSGLAPLALQHLVDAVSAPATVSRDTAPLLQVVGPALCYLLTLVGARVLAEIRQVHAGAVEQGLSAGLRQRLLTHWLDLTMASHRDRSGAQQLHAIQQAVTGGLLILGQLTHGVVPVLVELATVAWVLGQLAQPLLMATLLLTAITYIAIFAWAAGPLTRDAHAVSLASQGMHACLADALGQPETLKSLNLGPQVRHQLATASQHLEARWQGLYQRRGRLGLLLAAVFALATATTLALAWHGVKQGELTLGQFVLAQACLMQVVRPLEQIGAGIRDLSQAVAFITPALVMLQEPTEPALDRTVRSAPALDPVPCPTPSGHGMDVAHAPAIRFDGIGFAYDDGTPVLRDLDLDIAAGARLAIVGASGAGKSSLVRLLLRLYEPCAGRILLDQVPMSELPRTLVRDWMAVVPQDPTPLDETLAANIAAGRPGASRQAIESAARIAQLHDRILAMPQGYDTCVGERGLRLSGGERQRLAIARAVLRQPRICILDEATSMLDACTEAAVMQALRTALADCTLIVIAHRLSSVRDADEIVVLAQGRVAERGPHHALLVRQGHYARLWHAQQRGQSRATRWGSTGAPAAWATRR